MGSLTYCVETAHKEGLDLFFGRREGRDAPLTAKEVDLMAVALKNYLKLPSTPPYDAVLEIHWIYKAGMLPSFERAAECSHLWFEYLLNNGLIPDDPVDTGRDGSQEETDNVGKAIGRLDIETEGAEAKHEDPEGEPVVLEPWVHNWLDAVSELMALPSWEPFE